MLMDINYCHYNSVVYALLRKTVMHVVPFMFRPAAEVQEPLRYSHSSNAMRKLLAQLGHEICADFSKEFS